MSEDLRQSLDIDRRESFLDARSGCLACTAAYEGLARVLLKRKLGAESLKQSEYAKARAFSEASARRGTAPILPQHVDVTNETLSNQLTALKMRRRKAGKTKLESLQLARRHLRRHKYDHPSYWAGFMLVSEADQSAQVCLGETAQTC